MSIVNHPFRQTEGLSNFVKRYLPNGKEDKYKEFKDNNCLQAIVNHPEGRKSWTDDENKTCGDLYEQHAYDPMIKEGTAKEIQTLGEVFDKHCYNDKGLYKGFCYNDTVKSKFYDINKDEAKKKLMARGGFQHGVSNRRNNIQK